MSMHWFDYLALMLIILAYIVFYYRKSLLVKYGHKFTLTDPLGHDYNRLKEAIKNETDKSLINKYVIVNYSFRIFFITAIILLICFRALPNIF